MHCQIDWSSRKILCLSKFIIKIACYYSKREIIDIRTNTISLKSHNYNQSIRASERKTDKLKVSKGLNIWKTWQNFPAIIPSKIFQCQRATYYIMAIYKIFCHVIQRKRRLRNTEIFKKSLNSPKIKLHGKNSLNLKTNVEKHNSTITLLSKDDTCTSVIFSHAITCVIVRP